MIVWLWDVDGPVRYRGVTDNRDRAQRAAEACLHAGKATGARVEQAHVVTGFGSLTSGYRRTGMVWTAWRSPEGKAIAWSRLAA